MNTTAQPAMRPAAVPSRVGQATAVEQSRAIAEVEAAIVVAMRHPRNVSAAIEAMRETCRRKELADRAFWRYKRGGEPVTGATVHLARELARVWGNIQYGLSELRRDDDYGQSEMLAYAWDVQTNARCSSVVINPHRGYTGGRELTDLRDIYENNANVGARRVREAIFAVLPAWFVEEAKDLCSKTITDGGGVPLPQRIANAIEVFGNLGVTVPQLEAKIGAPSARWTDHDVAQLRVIRQSLLRGEISKDEEFPPPRVTAAELTRTPAAGDDTHKQPGGTSGQAQGGRGRGNRSAPPPPPQGTPMERLRGKMFALFAEAGWGDRDDRLRATSAILGRQVTTSEGLARKDLDKVVGRLENAIATGDPQLAVSEIVTAYEDGGQSREGDGAPGGDPPPAPGGGDGP